MIDMIYINREGDTKPPFEGPCGPVDPRPFECILINDLLEPMTLAV